MICALDVIEIFQRESEGERVEKVLSWATKEISKALEDFTAALEADKRCGFLLVSFILTA